MLLFICLQIQGAPDQMTLFIDRFVYTNREREGEKERERERERQRETERERKRERERLLGTSHQDGCTCRFLDFNIYCYLVIQQACSDLMDVFCWIQAVGWMEVGQTLRLKYTYKYVLRKNRGPVNSFWAKAYNKKRPQSMTAVLLVHLTSK